jgi:integrase
VPDSTAADVRHVWSGTNASSSPCIDFGENITKMLRGFNGDLRTVQAYAGHKDITSTMRYLVPESAEESQAKVDAIKW